MLCVVMGLNGCRAHGEFTGREYMPDMAHSQAYEYYTPSRFMVIDGDTVRWSPDGKSAREPVVGTVARGFTPYHYPDTPEGYEQAGAELFNPFNPIHGQVVEQGKLLYANNCAICHGDTGDGKGEIVANGAYPGGSAFVLH